MRTTYLYPACGLLLGLAACQRPNVAVTTPPTSDERPNLAFAARQPNELSVRVPGHEEQPEVPLTPSFKEPPLTRAEKIALRQDPEPYKPLLFDIPYRDPRIPVADYYAGQDVAVYGRGGIGGAKDVAQSTAAVDGWCGPGVHIGASRQPGGTVYTFERPRTGVTPWTALEVNFDRAAHGARTDPLSKE